MSSGRLRTALFVLFLPAIGVWAQSSRPDRAAVPADGKPAAAAESVRGGERENPARLEESPETPSSGVPQDVAREIERLKSPDPAERIKGARVLRFMGPRAAPAIPNLIALLDDNPDLPPVEQRCQFLSLNPTKPSPGSEAGAALFEIGDAAVAPLAREAADPASQKRDIAAWLLGEMRNPEAIPVLVAALGDKNPDVGYAASMALFKMGAPAVEPLLAALTGKNAQARAMAAYSFRYLKDPRAVEPLIKALGDENATVRARTEEALQSYQDPRATEPLITALRDPDAAVRRGALFALAYQKEESPRILEAVLSMPGEPDPGVRRGALDALGTIGHFRECSAAEAGRVLQYALQALRDPNEMVRQGARGVLRGLDLPGTGKALAEALQDKDPSYRAAAAYALEEAGGNNRFFESYPEALDALIAALADPDAKVRYHAARALQYALNKKAMDPLIQATRDGDPQVRTGAAMSLGNFRDPRVTSALVSVLKDPYPGARMWAADSLGRLKDKRAIEPLTALLGDEKADVRTFVVRALAMFDHPDALKALNQALEDKELRVRNQAAREIEKRAEQAKKKGQRVSPGGTTGGQKPVQKPVAGAQTADRYLDALSTATEQMDAIQAARLELERIKLRGQSAQKREEKIDLYFQAIEQVRKLRELHASRKPESIPPRETAALQLSLSGIEGYHKAILEEIAASNKAYKFKRARDLAERYRAFGQMPEAPWQVQRTVSEELVKTYIGLDEPNLELQARVALTTHGGGYWFWGGEGVTNRRYFVLLTKKPERNIAPLPWVRVLSPSSPTIEAESAEPIVYHHSESNSPSNAQMILQAAPGYLFTKIDVWGDVEVPQEPPPNYSSLFIRLDQYPFSSLIGPIQQMTDLEIRKPGRHQLGNSHELPSPWPLSRVFLRSSQDGKNIYKWRITAHFTQGDTYGAIRQVLVDTRENQRLQ